MKKNKFIHIAVTSIMLVSTFLTPQMSYAIANSQAKDSEETTQVEPTDAIIDENKENDLEDKSNNGGSTEVQHVDTVSESEATDDEMPDKEDDAVANGEPEDINANSPPVDEKEVKVKSFAPQEEVIQNLVTNFNLSYTTSDGTRVEVNNGETIEVDLNEMNAVALDYILVKPDELDIADGATYTIDLPAIFGQASPGVQEITIDNVVVATYVIENNQIVVTFNSEVNDFDDTDMDINVSGVFNTDVFETVEEVVVNVPYQEEDGYTATIRVERAEYEGEDKKVAGSPYVLDGENKVYNERNPEFVDWTVTANDSMGSYENARIIDDLNDNLEILEDSFVVRRLVRNYNNEIIDRVVVDATPEITSSGFELNLGEIEDAYEISYTTRVTRPDGGGTHTINNNARIILDGDETEVTDSFEGTWSGDIPMITKDGALTDDPHLIQWEVEYNYGREELGLVTLTDELSHGEVILDSIEIFEVETDIDGEVISQSDTQTIIEPVIVDGNVTLPDLDANGKAYFITFTSSVPVGLNETIINTISDNHGSVDDASVEVNTIPTGTKMSEQRVDEDGYPYIEWTITMNSEKIDVSTIEIIDIFNSEYLNINLNDPTLYELKRDGQAVDNFNLEPYRHEDGREGFELTISEAGPHTYEFVYRTYYTVAGMNEPNLANDAELLFKDGNGQGIGEGQSIGATQAGPLPGIYKTGEYITNEERTQQEIEWTITFNQSEILLENPEIIDDFTSGNYTYINGSLRVTAGDGPFENYKFSLNEDETGFTIQINEETKETFTIKYRTTIDEEFNEQQDNHVTLSWQGIDQTADATVGKRHPGIGKTHSILTDENGRPILDENGNKTINWVINFNENRNTLHDVVITDTTIPATSTISNIQLSRDGVVMEENAYTLTDPVNGTFTIEIDQLDAVPYTLTYSSTLSPAEEAANVNNEVNIAYTGGNQTAEESVPSPELGVQKEALHLDKSGDPDVISWSITANTDTANHLVNLVDAQLTDTIPADQRLVTGTVVAVRADDNSIIIDQADITEGENSFSINLPNGPYQYTVTFQTEILEYPSVNEKLDRYTNSTTLSNEHHEDVSDDAYIDYFADGTNNNNAKTGELNEDTENSDWNATVNPLGLTINNAEITDSLGNYHTYVEDTLKVMNDKDEELPEESFTINFAEDNRSFTITFADALTEPVKLSYSTRLDPELIGFYTIANNVSLSGGQDGRELSKESFSVSTSQWTYGGGGSGRTLGFTLNKNHESGAPIPDVTFEFMRVTHSGTEIPIGGTVTTDANGQFEIENARAGRYIVNETSVPEGFVRYEDPIYMTIGYANPSDLEPGDSEYIIQITDEKWNPIETDIAQGDGDQLTIYNEVETGSISATKSWVNGEQLNRPTTWLQLYRALPDAQPEPVENAAIQEITNNSPSTEVTWENIDLYSPEGTEYTFSVREVDAEGNDFVPENYAKAEEGLTVTNQYVIPTEGIARATKEWVNGPTERPTVWFELFRQIEGGELEEVPGVEIKELADGTTEVEWTGLEETDLQGNPYTFSVKEVDAEGNDFIPENYIKTEDGLTVINEYVIPKIDVTGSKNWEYGPEMKPSIDLQLYRDGEEIGEPVTLDGSEEIPWTYTWNNLDETTLDGQVYDYTVDEVNVPENYVKTADGLEVTNTYVSPKTEITGTKYWIDGPEETPTIELQLFRNGEAYGEPEVLESGVTEYTWTGLDLTDNYGNEYVYAVDEVSTPENYEKTISDNGLEIMNQYVIPTEGVARATKEWVDGPADKPTVWFELFRQIEGGDLEEVPGAEVKELADGTEEVEWTGLEETDINGNPYTFAVREVDAEGNDYTPENYVKAEDGLTVTNQYVIPTEGVARATKEWIDGPADKPTVWFKLFRQIEGGDLEEVPNAELKELADGTEEVEWTGLEETDINGNLYTFAVKEVDAEGNDYTPEHYVKTENGLEITNYYVSPTDASAKAVKIWENGSQEHPTVWFKLFRQIEGGELEEVPEAELKELSTGITEVVWTELTRTDRNGNEYVFSVQEVDAEGNDYTPENYVKTEDGLIVTNQYVIPEIEVTGKKVWVGGSSERPTIELQLYRDGEAFGDLIVLQNGVVEYTWSGLDKTDSAGNEYTYTIDEVNVPENYEKTISEDGLTITNTYVPFVSEEDPDTPEESDSESDDDSDLPQTGVASSYTWLALTLVGLGIGIHYYDKRRFNK